MVAPRAGAWIETFATQPDPCASDVSPPVRGRGLKLLCWSLWGEGFGGHPPYGGAGFIPAPTGNS